MAALAPVFTVVGVASTAVEADFKGAEVDLTGAEIWEAPLMAVEEAADNRPMAEADSHHMAEVHPKTAVVADNSLTGTEVVSRRTAMVANTTTMATTTVVVMTTMTAVVVTIMTTATTTTITTTGITTMTTTMTTTTMVGTWTQWQSVWRLA